MEMPHLGQHCSDSTCKQLDFLPFKCDACGKVFCLEHYPYEKHKCDSSYKKDVQVPVCPLCNKPLPLRRGELPDIIVGEHIDNDCNSDPAISRRKIYTNRCFVKGCKQKEIVKIECPSCRHNFCLRHRHMTDHDCTGPQNAASRAAQAALARNSKGGTDKSSTKAIAQAGTSSQNSRRDSQSKQSSSFAKGKPNSKPPPQPRKSPPRGRQAATAESVQGGMSEDEALARALQASMADGGSPDDVPTAASGLSAEDEDMMLARAIAESERDERNRLRQNNRQEQVVASDSGCGSDRCAIS